MSLSRSSGCGISGDFAQHVPATSRSSAEHALRVLALDGWAAQVTLPLLAPLSTQKLELRGVLDALGGDAQFERAREGDHGRRDLRISWRCHQVAHEGRVDLEDVDWECAETPDVRVAGSEVVDRDAHAPGAQRAQARDRLL